MTYLRENLRPRLCHIDRGLRFSRKERTFDVNKLFVIWLFAWPLQAARGHYGRIMTLVLANQSERYNSFKFKSCKRRLIVKILNDSISCFVGDQIVITSFNYRYIHRRKKLVYFHEENECVC